MSTHVRRPNDAYTSFPPPILEKLSDLSTTRLSDMDAGSVSLQIISHGPLNADAKTCKLANDNLAESCETHPARFGAFAMLPMSEPDAAAEGLSRCVERHGFLGALINNHLDGRFYDDEFFWPVFARAEKLDVPGCIHPTFAADEWMPHYEGNYPDQVSRCNSPKL